MLRRILTATIACLLALWIVLPVSFAQDLPRGDAGKEEPVDVSQVDVSMNGIELQDREFVAAIREGREPNSSVAQVLPCYRVLDQLEKQLGAR